MSKLHWEHNQLDPGLVRFCKRKARLVAIRYRLSLDKNHFWCDDWESYNQFDINIYCEENELFVTAYPLVPDVFGHLVPNTDLSFNVVHKDWRK